MTTTILHMTRAISQGQFHADEDKFFVCNRLLSREDFDALHVLSRIETAVAAVNVALCLARETGVAFGELVDMYLRMNDMSDALRRKLRKSLFPDT